jgi:hypothetical protein
LKIDNTILDTPRTRTLQRISAPTFYIDFVETNENYRSKGWATLLLIYTIAYLQKYWPDIKFFTLSDESDKRFHIEDNIYQSLGFIYMYNEAMDLSQDNRTIPTSQKKYLDFNPIIVLIIGLLDVVYISLMIL